MSNAVTAAPCSVLETDRAVRPCRPRAEEKRLDIRARSVCADKHGAEPHNLLSPGEQAMLTAIASIVDLPRDGARIFSEGGPADAIFAVASGVVSISRHDYGGGRHLLALMWPGDFFGMGRNGLYTESAIAASPATLYRLPIAGLRRLLLAEPGLQLHLLTKAVDDLLRARERMIVLGRESARHRIAAFLLEMCERPEVFDPVRGEIFLPISRVDVADYLGLAVETVSRALREIQLAGLISRKSARVFRVENMAGLIGLGQALTE